MAHITAAAQTRRQRALQTSREEIPLKAYLFALRALGRYPEAPLRRRLRQANDTLRASRERLKWGRANIAPEMGVADREAYFRCEVGRDLARDLKEHHELGGLPFGPEERAAIALFTGAGKCGEHAYATALLLAETLQPGEELVVMAHHGDVENHGWVELRRPGRPTIVLDASGEAPALLLQDFVHAAGQGTEWWTLTAADAPTAVARCSRMLVPLDTDYGEHLQPWIDDKRRAFTTYPADALRHVELDYVSGFDEDFARQGGQALSRTLRDETGHGLRRGAKRSHAQMQDPQALALSPEPARSERAWAYALGREFGDEPSLAQQHAGPIVEIAARLERTPQNVQAITGRMQPLP